MASEYTTESDAAIRRLPLHPSGRRLSFERRLRLWLWLAGLPGLVLCGMLMVEHSADPTVAVIVLLLYALVWLFLAAILMEQITRPLQTLANVVAALREDDYSFRARGAKREDAVGDLALEINALANTMQTQRAGALEAIALVERVVDSMQSPVLAFDRDGRLKLLNTAAERLFNLSAREVLGHTAAELRLERLEQAEDDALIGLEEGTQQGRWLVKRAAFRLRGVPHTLLVLSDVSTALREEERQAWKRLIRVLGHEINNSLTPIKSIAESLRMQVPSTVAEQEAREDFERGLEVIEGRSESLNRFLQAYRQLTGLPAPKLAGFALRGLLERVIQLETRMRVRLVTEGELEVRGDADQLQQALINLVRNAAEAALDQEPANERPCAEVGWRREAREVTIFFVDNGPGLANVGNLFVPFYTTKPNGTGIGLVLAQQIAEAHGGVLRLSNRSDGAHGCCAELTLPL